MPKKTCVNCRFSSLLDNNDGRMTCRRYPPAHVANETPGVPYVAEDYWCGEYRRRKKFALTDVMEDTDAQRT